MWNCPSSARTGTGHPWGGLDGSWLERRVSQPGDALPSQGLETGFWAGGTAGLAHLSCPYELCPHLHALPLYLGTQTRSALGNGSQGQPPSQSWDPSEPTAPPRSQHTISCCKEAKAPGQARKGFFYQLIRCMLMATKAGNKSHSMSHAATSRHRPPPLLKVELHRVSCLYLGL